MENSFKNSFDLGAEDNLDIKQEVQRYFRYWPWFVLAITVALISAYVYLRYAPRIYQTLF
jgi:uncharacterized protein involved in exopolysaccharide biosynthesis